MDGEIQSQNHIVSNEPINERIREKQRTRVMSKHNAEDYEDSEKILTIKASTHTCSSRRRMAKRTAIGHVCAWAPSSARTSGDKSRRRDKRAPSVAGLIPTSVVAAVVEADAAASVSAAEASATVESELRPSNGVGADDDADADADADADSAADTAVDAYAEAETDAAAAAKDDEHNSA